MEYLVVLGVMMLLFNNWNSIILCVDIKNKDNCDYWKRMFDI